MKDAVFREKPNTDNHFTYKFADALRFRLLMVYDMYF